ncbi:Protein aardvark [Porphyridium purpureum]|uniref:Protein aardvark n=1 Tax=Porphyridium purpureum TaxID=35688 RepID=A0A5J4Z554_PORPP|nr:Protein aardvark [Porphyridium purpureum]|eukprot:POR3567..scf295_1
MEIQDGNDNDDFAGQLLHAPINGRRVHDATAGVQSPPQQPSRHGAKPPSGMSTRKTSSGPTSPPGRTSSHANAAANHVRSPPRGPVSLSSLVVQHAPAAAAAAAAASSNPRNPGVTDSVDSLLNLNDVTLKNADKSPQGVRFAAQHADSVRSVQSAASEAYSSGLLNKGDALQPQQRPAQIPLWRTQSSAQRIRSDADANEAFGTSPPAAQRTTSRSSPATLSPSATPSDGLVGVAVDAMQSDVGAKTLHVQQRCISNLRSICEHSVASATQFIRGDGPALVVLAMSTHRLDETTQVAGLKLLGTVFDSVRAENERILEIVRDGAIALAVSAAHSFADSYSMAEAVVFFIGSLVMCSLRASEERGITKGTKGDENNSEGFAESALDGATDEPGPHPSYHPLTREIESQFSEKGVMGLLVDVMKRWRLEQSSTASASSVRSIVGFQNNCMAVIEHHALENTDCKSDVVQAGGVAPIIHNMEMVAVKGGFADQAVELRLLMQFMEQAIRTLCVLSCDSAPMQQHIGEMGGIEVIAAAMRQFDSQITLLAEGCITLRYLAFTKDNRDRMARCRAVEVIKMCIVRLQIEPLPTLNALLALSNCLYLSPRNEKLAVECGCVETVAGVMKLHHLNSSVQETGCRVFRNLAFQVRESKKSAVRSVMADTLISTLISFPEIHGIQMHGCAALVNLTDSYAKDLLGQRLEDHLDGILRRFQDDPELAQQARILIERMSQAQFAKMQKSKSSFITRAFSKQSSSYSGTGAASGDASSRSRSGSKRY